MGLYVYAVGRSGEGEPPPLQGVFDQPAYRLEVGPLCAVVSECPDRQVRAERRHIAATQARARRAQRAVRSCCRWRSAPITKSEDDLRQFLDDHQETLDGAVATGLRRDRNEPAFESRGCRSDRLSRRAHAGAAGGAGAGLPRPPTALQRRQDPPRPDVRRCAPALSRRAYGAGRRRTSRLPAPKSSPCRCARSGRSPTSRRWCPAPASIEFEAAVQLSAAQIDEDIAFTIGGPWPPHNFVQFDPRER